MPENDDDKDLAKPAPTARAEGDLAELKVLIQQHMAVSESRNRDLLLRIESRDRADAEFRGHMKGAMQTIQDRVAQVESQLPAVQKEARAAMQSHDDLHAYVHSTWDEQHASIMKRLDEQDAEDERRERVKREHREQESIAAKRLNDERTHKENHAKIWAPVWQAVAIAAIGAMATYAAARFAAANTEAKLTAVERTVESHTAVIEQTRNAVVSPQAASVSPPPAPAGAAPKK